MKRSARTDLPSFSRVINSGHKLHVRSVSIRMGCRRSWVVIPLLFLSTFARAQENAAREHFLIHPDRPFAYLHLNHIGLGSPEEDGKPHERVWLELHNNCALPIKLVVNGSPAGDSADSVSVMDRLVRRFQYRVLSAEEDAALGPSNMPRDTSFDVGSGYIVEPGAYLLFSLPASHFSRRWDIQIHFRFDLPTRDVMRDSDVWGGQTSMYLSYSLYDLPEPTQTELHKLGY